MNKEERKTTNQEKRELLQKNLKEIDEKDYDEYIKKYVKIKRVNLAKILAIAGTSTVIFSAFLGGYGYLFRDAGNEYKEINYYNVYYMDSEEKKIIKKDLTSIDSEENYLIIKEPWLLNENGGYTKKVSKIKFVDDISKDAEQLVKMDVKNIEKEINGVPSFVMEEYDSSPDLEDNNGEVSIVYKKLSRSEKVKKTKKDKNIDKICVISLTALGIWAGNIVGKAIIPYDCDTSYKKAKSKVKWLNSKKKRNKTDM